MGHTWLYLCGYYWLCTRESLLAVLRDCIMEFLLWNTRDQTWVNSMQGNTRMLLLSPQKKEILNFPAHVNKESFFGGEKANVSSCFFFLRSLQNFLKKKKITGKNITKMQMVGVKR